MVLSDQVRRLDRKWTGGSGWPQRLSWLEIEGIRGWTGQRIPFDFPIVAIVGENGSGKSTVLQSAACSYLNTGERGPFYPTEFFPETAWDAITEAAIRYGFRQGDRNLEGSVRKPTTRWLGQPDRPERRTEYIDLSRLQPVGTRIGYARIAKNKHREISAIDFSAPQLSRLSEIMGREYNAAKMAVTDFDETREIPVVTKDEVAYSGYHQGSGEITMVELLQAALPQYGLVLIDEIETSLHPRVQRRLIRDLAEQCRQRECQIILTTHSPYILEELPLQARIYILENGARRDIVTGVSPQFAMTKMDDQQHPECELYVEDNAAKVFLNEILTKHAKEVFVRCAVTPYGAANLGMALGQMVQANRFRAPTCVFLDGDNDAAPGCIILPGGDAPERVVFNGLRARRWGNLWSRIGRDIGVVSDACEAAMLLGDHHDWVNFAANRLMLGSESLWQAMCSEWASEQRIEDVQYLIDAIGDAIG
jgi:predicted ATPase